jgi:hypothetical protein
MVPPLRNDNILPNIFLLLISIVAFYHLTLYCFDTESVVTKRTKIHIKNSPQMKGLLGMEYISETLMK